MSSMAAESKTMEYDVALTLLNLHSGGNVSTKRNSPRPDECVKNAKNEDTEEKTRLILNCVISSEVEVETSPSTITTPSFRHLASPKLSKIRLNNNSNGASTSQMKQNVSPYQFDIPKFTSPLQKETESREIRTTREIGIQTDDYLMFDTQNVFMNMHYKMLCDRIKTLEAMNNNCACKSKISDTTDRQSLSTNADEYTYDDTGDDPDYDVTMDYEEDVPSHSQYRGSSHGKKTSRESRPIFTGRRVLANVNNKANDLVPIGEGNAKVPSRILRHINWTSYSSATRKLLTAVFSRNILASHSLTGKPSPAFPNKPAKKRLNPALVNDIVQTVVERCCVPENVVRTSITTKCADESKMWRTRQKCNMNKKRLKLNKKIKEERKKNRENIPPETSESDSDL